MQRYSMPLSCALSLQLAETKLKVDLVERERDFYFDKLRDIEILCQMPELQKVPVSSRLHSCIICAQPRTALLCWVLNWCRARALSLCVCVHTHALPDEGHSGHVCCAGGQVL